VNYLSRRLDAVEVVRQAPPARDRVYFSAYVTLSDPEGETRTYRIVGADETDAPLGYISVDSPLARALLGKRKGDSVAVSLPDGSAEYCIESIDYEN
jgi:transcription elongation factor GreB